MSDTTAHLNSTIESLSKGLEKAKPGATRSITSWTKELNGSDDESLKKIGGELEKLHDLLGKDDFTAAQLKKALTSLGKHTTAAAKKAEGSKADKIKELGQLLTDAADGLK